MQFLYMGSIQKMLQKLPSLEVQASTNEVRYEVKERTTGCSADMICPIHHLVVARYTQRKSVDAIVGLT
jgi:hypothetical protein